MSGHKHHSFFVIQGGGQGAAAPMALPEVPVQSVAELAADMAELFIMALAQDVPLSGLTDPHQPVQIDAQTHVTMHDLLCELRNLPWFDDLPPADAPACGRRRARLNEDGQLSLPSLMRATVPAAPATLSAKVPTMPRTDIDTPKPARAAPLATWLRWSQSHCSNGIAPGLTPSSAPDTLAGRLEQMVSQHPADQMHAAARDALAQGTQVDPGLVQWGGSDLFAAMAAAEQRAVRAAVQVAGRQDRLSRPAVTAARLSVALSTPSRGQSQIDAAAQHLNDHAPRLIDWLTRANTHRRGPQRVEICLFLPLTEPFQIATHPADTALHVIVASALATLTKAVLHSQRPGGLHSVDQTGPDLSLAPKLDRLCADLAAARMVSGGYYGSENLRDLELGQDIALHVLRDMLEEDNIAAQLSFSDFRGRDVMVQCHPRPTRPGQAHLFIDGARGDWPLDAPCRSAHLTAVV